MRSISAKVTLDINELKRRGKEGGDVFRGLGKDIKDTSKQATADFDAMTKRAVALEVQMFATAKATDQLVKAFAHTGDSTLLKQIDQQRKSMKELQNARNLLPDNAAIARAGASMGSQLATTVGSGLTRALPAALTAGGGAAAAIGAPFIAGLTVLIGSAAAAAILGGGAGLGIAGGLKIAARDASVKQAAKSLSDSVGTQLESAAEPFVPATRRVLREAEKDFSSFRSDLDKIFDTSSSFLLPLEKGAAGFAGNILGELPDALKAAQPIIEVVSADLPELGAAIGGLFAILSDNGPEAALALQNVFNIIESSIQTASLAINALIEIYGFAAKTGLMGRDVQLQYLAMEIAQRSAADANRDGAAAANSQAEASRSAASAAEEQRAAAQALSDQLHADTDPVLGFLDAQDRVTKSQKAAAEATAEHGRSSSEAQAALRQLTRDSVGLQDAAGKLGTAFDGKMTPALRATLRAAGLTKGQVNELAGQFAAAKKQGDRFAKEYRARVAGLDRVRALAEAVAMLPGRKDVQIAIRVTGNTNVQSVRSALDKQSRGAYQRRGGVMTAMAEGGSLSPGIYPASNPPMVKFAEPETGGELYLPRRGDRTRGRQLVAQAADWYGMAALPMARGGLTMARGGYVNVAQTSSTAVRTGSRLDSASAALDARNAVVSLNTALRENGRSFSESTKKGRENRSTLIQGIQAAQGAAEAKFAETGSVRLANREYDQYIRRLKDVLGQQKASSALLTSLAARPQYDTAAPAAPKNSMGNIAYVRSLMDRGNATSTARTFFNSGWGTPRFNTGTAFGQDNYNALFAFLDSAQGAAQARFSQTGNARSASRLYNSSLGSLRSILTQAGVPKKEIDRLLNSYGRITLGNRDGGVYEHMAAGGLNEAHIAAGGPTRYAYAEPSTGGELFAPKRGNLAKTRQEVSWAVSNWWGGDVAWQGGPGSGRGSGGAMTIRLVVDSGELAGAFSVVVDEQLGALADASIHQTTA